ncbi:hypothetical protein At1D1108_52540 (plasmid) [Agrobacterium tumefaciens]|uniref:Uncharacterized protein n=1 Tax=Agrobacterium tumefaciens TaxID=358 RepID=A0A5B9TAC4_AGRTU|nr:hypothetical protein NCHU2750_56670 [Neorhizobium sp. NCHU2750]AYM14880.1 hypothetical protein At1D1108_52540 [Agrobacterium tumefaciens]MBP1880775.1 hypothetical protein [Agrobacterium rubi]QEG97057.1 hypothetical protein AgrTiSule1_00134 [Agrobacterium tumefaciens]QEG97259.1 hypothetical protein AgrTiCFBP2178_00134 [Agrobacterium tumefaciens]
MTSESASPDAVRDLYPAHCDKLLNSGGEAITGA